MEQDVFAAITANDKDRVAQLIAADPAVAHARNAAGISALMQARYENRAEIVELLRPAAGELDIFEAAALGDVARLNKLLTNDREVVKARSADGFTPLHLACFFGQLKAAEILIQHGADTNAVSPSRIAVIHSAAASRNAALLKLGLARRSESRLAAATWLHRVARGGHAQQCGEGAGAVGRGGRSGHQERRWADCGRYGRAKWRQGSDRVAGVKEIECRSDTGQASICSFATAEWFRRITVPVRTAQNSNSTLATLA